MTISTLTARHFALLPVLLLLVASGLTAPSARAADPPPPLPLPLEVMTGSASWSDVQAQAAAEAASADPNATPPIQGGSPKYRSTQVENVSFEGDFTPDVNHTDLAIFSDDGADVTIDGSKVWSGKGTAQALPTLSQSLHQLGKFNAGQTYHIRIDYSNVYYDGDGDIDGVTLFAYADPPVVTLDLSGVDSLALDADIEGSGPIKASVSNAPQSTAACQVTSVEWNWDFGDVEYSTDGQTNWGVPSGDVGYEMTIDDASVPTTNFNMTLDPGYWEVILTATVIYHTTCGDISATSSDYVGQPF